MSSSEERKKIGVPAASVSRSVELPRYAEAGIAEVRYGRGDRVGPATHPDPSSKRTRRCGARRGRLGKKAGAALCPGPKAD